MPFELGDYALAIMMALSGLFAFFRGFTRELLSLAAWVLAVAGTLLALSSEAVMGFAQSYIAQEVFARIAVGVTCFLMILVLASVASVKLAERVVDSAVRPVDRNLGLLYGLARGFIFAAFLYMIYVWLTPPDRQARMIREAWSRPAIAATAQQLGDAMRFVAEISPLSGDDILGGGVSLKDDDAGSENDGAIGDAGRFKTLLETITR